MTMQDRTAVRAEAAFAEAELIDGGPAVSWGAIFAGAVAASALSFVLLAIGAAFGLSITSPWDFTGRDAGEAAAAAGIGTAIFLVVVHALASGVGGYLAGRLRSKLIGLRGDETYFRDTAHGLVVWAVAALTTVLIIACLALTAARGGIALGAASINAAGQAAGGALSAAAPALRDERRGGDMVAYFVDALFRPDTIPQRGGTGGSGTTGQGATGQGATGQGATGQAAPMVLEPDTMMAMPEARPDSDRRGLREEIGRIFRRAIDGDLSPEDKGYVAQVVARETGLTQAQAEERVNQVIDRAKAARAEAEQTAREAAEVARQAGMYAALWGAIAMLAGAFAAALAATWGGRARDL